MVSKILKFVVLSPVSFLVAYSKYGGRIFFSIIALNFCQNTRRHIRENFNLQSQRCENHERYKSEYFLHIAHSWTSGCVQSGRQKAPPRVFPSCHPSSCEFNITIGSDIHMEAQDGLFSLQHISWPEHTLNKFLSPLFNVYFYLILQISELLRT